MKCVKSMSDDINIVRVNEKEADKLVKTGLWKYVPKSEWKKIHEPDQSSDNKISKIKKSKKSKK